ncbi:MAG: hypothetical protein R3D05_12465 [Dongiaceae bacterium]
MSPNIASRRRVIAKIKPHGHTADMEAAARANEYEAEAERDGWRAWLRTLRAIDVPRAVKPDEPMQ